MFNGSPFVVQFGRFGRRFGGGAAAGWLLMGPGLALAGVGLAILIWPELLAYMVAGLLLFAGLTLSVWGWQMTRAARRVGQQMRNGYSEVWYEESRF